MIESYFNSMSSSDYKFAISMLYSDESITDENVNKMVSIIDTYNGNMHDISILSAIVDLYTRTKDIDIFGSFSSLELNDHEIGALNFLKDMIKLFFDFTELTLLDICMSSPFITEGINDFSKSNDIETRKSIHLNMLKHSSEIVSDENIRDAIKLIISRAVLNNASNVLSMQSSVEYCKSIASFIIKHDDELVSKSVNILMEMQDKWKN